MAAVSIKRIDIRRMVRRKLRSDDFPKDDIDDAINSVIEQINVMGRFRFHKTFTDITMVTDDYDYAVPTTMLAEELLVFDPPTSTKPSTKPIPKIVLKAPSASRLLMIATSSDGPDSSFLLSMVVTTYDWSKSIVDAPGWTIGSSPRSVTPDPWAAWVPRTAKVIEVVAAAVDV